MPLSEHEQNLLDQLEKQLHADDPKFANALASDPNRSLSTRRIVIGLLVLIVGLMVLLGGVSLTHSSTIGGIAVGVLGFLVMGGGVYLASSKGKYQRNNSAQSTPSAPKEKSSFMNNLENRWEDRRREP